MRMSMAGTDASSVADKTVMCRWENSEAGRYYEARIVRDLFGDWQVMRVWGGIGSGRGALRFDPLDKPGTFADELARIDKRRIQRGYVLRP